MGAEVLRIRGQKPRRLWLQLPLPPWVVHQQHAAADTQWCLLGGQPTLASGCGQAGFRSAVQRTKANRQLHSNELRGMVDPERNHRPPSVPFASSKSPSLVVLGPWATSRLVLPLASYRLQPPPFKSVTQTTLPSCF